MAQGRVVGGVLICPDCLAAEVEQLTRDNKHLIESCERQADLYIKSANRADRYRSELERIAALSRQSAVLAPAMIETVLEI